MTESTTEMVMALINVLEGFRGNKSAQAVYLQAFVQQYGPVPEEYSAKVRKLME